MAFPTHFPSPSLGSSLIDMKDFIQQICLDLTKRNGYSDSAINLRIEPIKLPAETGAFPIAILVHELVTNAFQHAFPAVPNPKLYVNLRVQNSKHLFLEVRDNGPGLIHSTGTDSFSLKNPSKIQNFVKQQFKGDLIYEFKSGACFAVMIQNFPDL